MKSRNDASAEWRNVRIRSTERDVIGQVDDVRSFIGTGAAMKCLAIVTQCILAAVVYGIIHDQITVRVCVEYFTIGHPPIFATDDPTLLGLGWGVIATWWMGAALGFLLAAAARMGPRKPVSPSDLNRPIGRLLVVMAIFAASAGIAGYSAGTVGLVELTGRLARLVPEERHARFLADLWAHSASYFVGFFGGLRVVVMTYRSRPSMMQQREP